MRLLFAACSVLFGLSLAAAVDPCVFCGSAIHNGERCPFAPDDARSAVEAFNQHGTEIPDALIQKYGTTPHVPTTSNKKTNSKMQRVARIL